MSHKTIAVAVLAVVAGVGALQFFNGRATDTSTEPQATNSTSAPRTGKPVCATLTNSSTAPPIDCIPANLPPDPGEAGKVAIDGIVTDNDCDPVWATPSTPPKRACIRDDVRRWIVLNYPSPIAVAALTKWAEVEQLGVHYGDDLSGEETRKLAPEMDRKIACFALLETESMLGASKKLSAVVRNTDERRKRYRAFDNLFGHHLYTNPIYTPEQACGFDPATLGDEPTIAAQLSAEHAERAKREEEKK